MKATISSGSGGGSNPPAPTPPTPPAPPADPGNSGGGSSTQSPDVEPSAPVSPDVRPESPDVGPVSPDMPVPDDNPESRDMTPESPDIPVPPDVNPESPDVPPDTPSIDPESPDVPSPAPDEPGESGDNPGGGGSTDDPVPTPDEPSSPDEPSAPGDSEPSSAQPGESALDVADDSVIREILDVMSQVLSFITPDTEVAELPDSAVGGERTIADVSDEELAALPEDETPAVILPIIVVTESKVYVFGVDLSELETGAVIRLHLMPDSSASEAFAADASDSSQAYTFFDDDGNEVTTVPANKHVNVAAYMEAGRSYAPIITTSTAAPSPAPAPDTPGQPENPGSEQEPASTPETDTGGTSTGSSGGGGCYGVSAGIAALAAVFLLNRKH